MLEGNWTMSKIDLTKEGLENPDTITNFSFSLSTPYRNQSYTSEIYCTSPSHLCPKNFLHPQSSPTDLKYSISLDLNFQSPDNTTIEFNFTLDNNFTINGEFITSINGIVTSTGSFNSPYNFSYSFTFLSSYRAQLSLFDRNTGQVTIFRFWKEFDTHRSWEFGKYASFIARRILFSVF